MHKAQDGPSLVGLAIARLIVFLGSLLLTMLPALAEGPFGIEKGIATTQLDVKKAWEDHFFDLRTAPHSDPMFARYAVRATARYGVCGVTAVTAPFRGLFEIGVDEARSQVVAYLSRSFGPPEAQYKTSRADSVLYDPTSSIAGGISTVDAVWSRESGATLPDNVTVAIMEIVSLDNSQYVFRLSLAFDNESECISDWLQVREQPPRQEYDCWDLTGTEAERQICFDGRGGVASSIVHRDAGIGIEVLETVGRYWGRDGTIHFAVAEPGDGWLWGVAAVKCDLVEDGARAGLLNCTTEGQVGGQVALGDFWFEVLP